jgi:hypothetical protein
MRFAEVSARVAIFRRIAAAYVAALQAHAQVHPLSANLEAVFATLAARLHFLYVILLVCALRSHARLH